MKIPFITKDYIVNELKNKEWKDLENAEFLIIQASKKVKSLINRTDIIWGENTNLTELEKQAIIDATAEYAFFYETTNYDFTNGSISVNIGTSSFSENRTFNDQVVLDNVYDILSKAGLLVNQAASYIQNFYNSNNNYIFDTENLDAKSLIRLLKKNELQEFIQETFRARTGAKGEKGDKPTPEEIREQVELFFNENPNLFKGEQGIQGNQGLPGLKPTKEELINLISDFMLANTDKFQGKQGIQGIPGREVIFISKGQILEFDSIKELEHFESHFNLRRDFHHKITEQAEKGLKIAFLEPIVRGIDFSGDLELLKGAKGDKPDSQDIKIEVEKFLRDNIALFKGEKGENAPKPTNEELIALISQFMLENTEIFKGEKGNDGISREQFNNELAGKQNSLPSTQGLYKVIKVDDNGEVEYDDIDIGGEAIYHMNERVEAIKQEIQMLKDIDMMFASEKQDKLKSTNNQFKTIKVDEYGEIEYADLPTIPKVDLTPINNEINSLKSKMGSKANKNETANKITSLETSVAELKKVYSNQTKAKKEFTLERLLAGRDSNSGEFVKTFKTTGNINELKELMFKYGKDFLNTNLNLYLITIKPKGGISSSNVEETEKMIVEKITFDNNNYSIEFNTSSGKFIYDFNKYNQGFIYQGDKIKHNQSYSKEFRKIVIIS